MSAPQAPQAFSPAPRSPRYGQVSGQGIGSAPRDPAVIDAQRSQISLQISRTNGSQRNAYAAYGAIAPPLAHTYVPQTPIPTISPQESYLSPHAAHHHDNASYATRVQSNQSNLFQSAANPIPGQDALEASYKRLSERSPVRIQPGAPQQPPWQQGQPYPQPSRNMPPWNQPLSIPRSQMGGFETPFVSSSVPKPVLASPSQKPRQVELPPQDAPQSKRSSLKSGITIALVIATVLCFGVAITLHILDGLARQKMASMAPESTAASIDEMSPLEDDDASPLADVDSRSPSENAETWDQALAAYPGLVAWIKANDGSLSTPVMQGNETEPDYYLSHDAFGNKDSLGLPYLDWHTTPTSLLRVVYGHNLGWGSNERFSPLADAWHQEAFDALSPLVWTQAPDSSDSIEDSEKRELFSTASTTFTPLCAFKVAGTESTLFEYSLDLQRLREWLETTLDRSSASIQNARARVQDASEILALVTCAGDGIPSASRVIVMYESASGQPSAPSTLSQTSHENAKVTSDAIRSTRSESTNHTIDPAPEETLNSSVSDQSQTTLESETKNRREAQS